MPRSWRGPRAGDFPETIRARRKVFTNVSIKGCVLTGGVLLALWSTGDRLALPRSSPNRLRFAHTFTTESERAIIDSAIAEFESTHPSVRIEQIVSNSETYNSLGWRLQFQGRHQPDLYFHWQGFKAETCIEKGWALDLTPFLHGGFVDQFVPAAIQKHKGGFYFVPQSVDLSNLVWYNRDLFASLHLPEPRSLQDWFQVCEALRRAKILPLVQGNRDLWPMGNLGAELEGQALGAAAWGRLFQPRQPITLGDLAGLKTFVTFRESGCFDLPGVLDAGAIGGFNDIDAKVFFLGGKAGQHIIGSWFLADVNDALARNELKFSVGVFPVPAAPGETDALTSVTTGYLVNPASRNPQAAVDFLELLLSRKFQSEFAKIGNLSARRDAAEFTINPLARRMLEILSATPVMVPPPDTGYRPEQAAIFYEICGKLVTGKLTLEEAAAAWSNDKASLARKGL